MVFLKEFFQKGDFKKSADDKQAEKNSPWSKEFGIKAVYFYVRSQKGNHAVDSTVWQW